MGMISIALLLLALFAVLAVVRRKIGRPASRDDSDIVALSGLSTMAAASDLGASDSGHDGGSHDGGSADGGGSGD